MGQWGVSPMSLTMVAAALCPAHPMTDPAGKVPADAEYRPWGTTAAERGGEGDQLGIIGQQDKAML